MSFWSFVPDLITAGVKLWGAREESDALNQATQSANAANQRSTDQLVQAQNQATQAQLASNKEALQVIRQGIDTANSNYTQQMEMASPGLVAMQGIVGRGEALTPEQIAAIEEGRRMSLDALQGGSLRGSARATAATVNDVQGTMNQNFIAQNRARADAAAGQLSNQYFSAGDDMANNNIKGSHLVSSGLINAGDIKATNANNTGKYTSDNTIMTGNNNAYNTVTQSRIKGSALGDISAVLADYMKQDNQKNRDETYGKKEDI